MWILKIVRLHFILSKLIMKWKIITHWSNGNSSLLLFCVFQEEHLITPTLFSAKTSLENHAMCLSHDWTNTALSTNLSHLRFPHYWFTLIICSRIPTNIVFAISTSLTIFLLKRRHLPYIPSISFLSKKSLMRQTTFTNIFEEKNLTFIKM